MLIHLELMDQLFEHIPALARNRQHHPQPQDTLECTLQAGLQAQTVKESSDREVGYTSSPSGH